jgi:hypothetical protein
MPVVDADAVIVDAGYLERGQVGIFLKFFVYFCDRTIQHDRWNLAPSSSAGSHFRLKHESEQNYRSDVNQQHSSPA